jgi:hypothetical protein
MTHQVQQLEVARPPALVALMDAMLDLQAAQASLLAVASSPLGSHRSYHDLMEEFHDHQTDVEEFLCVDGVTLI